MTKGVMFTTSRCNKVKIYASLQCDSNPWLIASRSDLNPTELPYIEPHSELGQFLVSYINTSTSRIRQEHTYMYCMVIDEDRWYLRSRQNKFNTFFSRVFCNCFITYSKNNTQPVSSHKNDISATLDDDWTPNLSTVFQ